MTKVIYAADFHGGREATLSVALADVFIHTAAPFMVVPTGLAKRFVEAMEKAADFTMRDLLVDASRSLLFVEHGVPAWHVLVCSCARRQPWPVVVTVCGEVVCEFYPRKFDAPLLSDQSLSTFPTLERESAAVARDGRTWADFDTGEEVRRLIAQKEERVCAFCGKAAGYCHSHPKLRAAPILTCGERLCFQRGWERVYGAVYSSVPLTADGREFPRVECSLL